jgi:2,5-diamino-6-(ribosylamino)-4(3H)-pyrimidinone 5'-phosphate reductase
MMERPHVHINVAATADGKIDTFERRGAAISSARDKERVDRLRAGADAVMVGGRTLHDEDPKLTVKSELLRAERLALGLPPNPAKVGVASQLDLKPDSNFLTAGPARIILFTTSHTEESQLSMLRSLNAEVFILGEDRVDLAGAMKMLNGNGVRRLMVEGGATLNFELMHLGLVDELTIYIAPMIFGGESAPTTAAGSGLVRSAAIPLRLLKFEEWEDGGVLLHYRLSKEG